MNENLQIGDVADLFETTTKTLRHYEKLGLLDPERSENGYRVYSADNILHIKRIRMLQTLGLSLKRIKTMLEQDNPASVWDGVLSELLHETEQKIDDLLARRDRLEALLDGEDGVSAESITIARPPDDDRVNAYLETHLKPTANALWQNEYRLFSMLAHWQQTGIWLAPVEIGYAGPIPAGALPAIFIEDCVAQTFDMQVMPTISAINS